MYKKIIAILMCCLFALSGCGQTANENGDLPKEEYAVDLDGYVCTLYTDRKATDVLFKYKVDTVEYDIILKRIDDVKKELNCDIIVENTGGYTLDSNNYVLSSLATGDSFAEIMNGSCNSISAELAYAGYLTPLSSLKEIIDYTDSDKYGSPALLECAMYEGEPYAVQPAYWLGYHGASCFLITYNRDLIKTLGLENPQEHLEKKDWTWETFENTLKTFYIDNGENTIPVLSAPTRAMTELALLSNNVRFADYFEDQLKTDIYTDKSIKAINWIINIYKNYYPTSIVDKAGDGYWDTSKFVNQTVLMDIENGEGAINGDVQYKADFEFGLMPFPGGPDAPYGQWAHWYEQIDGFSIPYSAEDPESAAHVINRLFEPFEEYGNKVGLLDYYSHNVFVDRLDAEIFLNAADSARYCYWKVGGLDLSMRIAENINSKTATQMVEAYGPAYEEVITKYMMPNFKYMYENMYNKQTPPVE